MEQKLQNQIAIITGASSGIGSGIAKCIAASGATVIINHSSQSSKPSAETILKEITDDGGSGITYQCDVSKEEEVIKNVSGCYCAIRYRGYPDQQCRGTERRKVY